MLARVAYRTAVFRGTRTIARTAAIPFRHRAFTRTAAETFAKIPPKYKVAAAASLALASGGTIYIYLERKTDRAIINLKNHFLDEYNKPDTNFTKLTQSLHNLNALLHHHLTTEQKKSIYNFIHGLIYKTITDKRLCDLFTDECPAIILNDTQANIFNLIMNDKFTVQTYAREYALNSILYKYAKDISFADPNKLSFVKMITMLCKYNGYEPELAERTLDEICKLIESRIENLVSKDGVVSEKDYSDNKLRVLIDLISAQGLQKRFSEKFFDLLPKKVPT